MSTHTDSPTLRIRDEHGNTLRTITGSTPHLMDEARRLLRYYSDSHDATICGTYHGAREEVVATRDGAMGSIDAEEEERRIRADA